MCLGSKHVDLSGHTVPIGFRRPIKPVLEEQPPAVLIKHENSSNKRNLIANLKETGFI